MTSSGVAIQAGWTDGEGEHRLVLSRSESRGDLDLYGQHFLRGVDGKWTALWQVHDFVHACEVDSTAEFFGDIEVTDLDTDGIAETSFAYLVSCKGDISPHTLKLLMHEGKTKYAIRLSTCSLRLVRTA